MTIRPLPLIAAALLIASGGMSQAQSPPVNKLPEPEAAGKAPRVAERFQMPQGSPVAAISGGVQIVNPKENGHTVSFSLGDQEYRLAAGQGTQLEIEGRHNLLSFLPNPDADSLISQPLRAGEAVAFTFASGNWQLQSAKAWFQTVVDNGRNPHSFRGLLNGQEKGVAAYQSMAFTSPNPMTLVFDSGDGQSPTTIHLGNSNGFKLVGSSKDQSENRVEVVHETMLKVALSDQNNWVLVDRANWQQVTGGVEPQQAAPPAKVIAAEQPSAAKTASVAATAKPVLPAKPVAASAAAKSLPKLFVLAVGVSKYKDARYNLSFAHRDAEAFAEVWKKQAGLSYREVEARVLTNEQATKRNIESALGWLEREVTSGDNVVLMISGHGMLDPKNRFYIATHDMDDQNLKATCLPRSSLEDTLGILAGGQALVFLDTCHSGQDFGTASAVRKAGVGVEALQNLRDAGQGVVVFTSSSADEVSLEKDLWGHGAFTKAFLDALQEPLVTDLNADGYLAINELDFALQERVKNLTDGQQHPSYDKSQSIKTGGRILRFR